MSESSRVEFDPIRDKSNFFWSDSIRRFDRSPNVIHPQARHPIQNEIKSLNLYGVSRLGVDYVIAGDGSEVWAKPNLVKRRRV